MEIIWWFLELLVILSVIVPLSFGTILAWDGLWKCFKENGLIHWDWWIDNIKIIYYLEIYLISSPVRYALKRMRQGKKSKISGID